MPLTTGTSATRGPRVSRSSIKVARKLAKVNFCAAPLAADPFEIAREHVLLMIQFSRYAKEMNSKRFFFFIRGAFQFAALTSFERFYWPTGCRTGAENGNSSRFSAPFVSRERNARENTQVPYESRR